MHFDLLKSLTKRGGGTKIKDEQIIAWANQQTQSNGVAIDNFKDPKISDLNPILILLNLIKPETIDWSIYGSTGTEEGKIRNAKYVLSIIRKFSGNISALSEDLVEMQSQMVMIMYASIMAMQ
jgi:plastin-2